MKRRGRSITEQVARSAALGLGGLLLIVGGRVGTAEALAISNVQITPSDHGVTVAFDTDVLVYTAFVTAIDPVGRAERSIYDYSGGTHHVLTDYDDLFYAAQTSYQVVAKAQAVRNTLPIVSMGPFTFVTAVDVTPPTITRVRINNIGSHSAAISWESDTYPGTGMVDYGPTLAYGQVATTTAANFCGLSECRSRQTVILTNLQPMSRSHFQVRRDDGSGNQAVPLGNFTLLTDALWTQQAFWSGAILYGSTCALVGDAPGCPESLVSWPQEMSWTGNELTVHFNATAEDLTRGSLVFEASVIYVQQINGKWVTLELAGGSDPNTLVVINPGGVTMDHPAVYAVAVPANIFAPGANYLRLRATTISTAEIGYGRAAPVAVWNRMQMRFAQLSPPVLTDASLLDQTHAQAARYFWEQAFTTSGLVRDTMNSLRASSAATGFGLASLAVMAERYGSSSEWTVTPVQARARAQQILDAAVAIQRQQASDSGRYGKAGFLYHFIGEDRQRYRDLPSGIAASQSDVEVSTVDTALFAAGALAAGQYFGGSVQARADEFFGNLDWSYFFDPVSAQFYHAWKPEGVPEFQVPSPDGDGRLSNQRWDRPTDEALLINLLALARDPSNSGFRRSLYAWPRAVRRYAGYDVVNSFFGSFFTYVFGQCFFDFGAMHADNPAAVGAAAQPVDWFANAKNAALANRQFVIDQAGSFLTYGSEQWGLSACFRPDGSYFGENGAKPTEFNNGTPSHDGTVPPYGAISALPLVRTSPTELLSANLAFQALRNYYTNHFSGLWGAYGPRDSLKRQLQTGQPVTAYSPLYVGIDLGPEVLMMEQYRSGLVTRAFMSHPSVRNAISLQFPTVDNRAPVLNPVGDQTVAEGQLLTLTLSAVDPNGSPLTYTASGLPSGATLTGQALTWTPSYTQAGNYPMTVAVSDGVLQDSEPITITVVNTNRAPMANTGPDQTTASGSFVTLDGSGSSDPDGDALTYTWTQTNGPAVTLSNSTSARPTFTAPSVATNTALRFVLAARDGSLSATDDVIVTVTPSVTGRQTPWQTNAYGTLYTSRAYNYAMGYHFTPLVDGQIAALGGFFSGTKVVKLFNKATGVLLASATVSAANTWAYTSIVPVNVTAGTAYTVAVYLAGSGGSARSGLNPALPRAFGGIRIDGSTYAYTGTTSSARPTNTVTGTMYGQADIEFVPAQTPWQTNAYGTLYTSRAYNYAMGYHFTPLVNGQVTALGGFFNGTKTVKLFNKATGVLLASATVTAANSWGYTSIVPVNVTAGTTYTVAVYLAGSGGSYRYPLSPALPRAYGGVRIEGSTYAYTGSLPTARPTNTITGTMYGQTDIRFIPQ